jgi:hypothetical protein
MVYRQMKLLFEIEEYEDTKDAPFELSFYFYKRLYMYIVEKGQKQHSVMVFY